MLVSTTTEQPGVGIIRKFRIFFLKKRKGAGGMAQWLELLTAL